jgi:hypothetical protein
VQLGISPVDYELLTVAERDAIVRELNSKRGRGTGRRRRR